MKVEDEVFSLASELIRRFSDKEIHECNFSMERAEFMNDEDFLYQLPETPQFLESNGLVELLSDDLAIVAPSFWTHLGLGWHNIYQLRTGEERKYSFLNSLSSHKMNVRGFYSVAFNIESLKNWYEKQLAQRILSNNLPFERKPVGWGWKDITTNTYQFGELGQFSQGGETRGLIFKEAMQLFEETPQAISIKTLSERTHIDAPRLRIDLNAINIRLSKIGLTFSSTNHGYYRLTKIS